MTGEELKRYNRHIILPGIGHEGQQKLKEASVLVIGCGGLGCPVLQYLAAAGIGNITIVDPDVVSESNLQRQILYSTEDVGKPKVTIARNKLLQLNPLINIHAYQAVFDGSNCLEMVNNCSIVVDCSDNFATRYVINDCCVESGKVMVYGSVFQFEGQVAVFNYKQGPTYRSLYPEQPEDASDPEEIGVMGILPGIIGLIQATEVVKIITGIGEVLSGRFMVYNALDMKFQTFKI